MGHIDLRGNEIMQTLLSKMKGGMGKLSVVGKSVIRTDALEKVMGKALFGTDVTLSGMLHAKALREKAKR